MPPRFYVPGTSFISSQLVSLPPQAVHHAMRVLRLREGDEVEVFDGDGNSATGSIQFAKDRAEVLLEKVAPPAKEKIRIILLQALVANDKMDWIVEKACELGTSKLLIFPPERTDIRINEEKLNKKLERWQRIAVAACTQCGRNKLPEIDYSPTLQDALGKGEGFRILLHPANEKNSASFPKEVKAVSFLIGPEGGFAQKEIASALDAGYEAIKLGELILRTETAGMAATAFAQTLWGSYHPY